MRSICFTKVSSSCTSAFLKQAMQEIKTVWSYNLEYFLFHNQNSQIGRGLIIKQSYQQLQLLAMEMSYGWKNLHA